MPTVTVKNIPPEIYQKLKQAANSNHRSINSEIIACIERAVDSQRINPDAFLASARKLRAQTASYPVNDNEFTQAKTADRL